MNTTSLVALVPVRDPASAKTRLAPALPADARASLVQAMLADVVAALAGGGLRRIVVLAGGTQAAAAARALGVDVLLDPPGDHGLDAALLAASRRIRAGTSLVVPADLPLLRPDDVRAIIGEPGEVVVAPTTDGGTGGLLRRPAWGIETTYGGRSAAEHLYVARQAGLSAERVEITGFSLDVDTPDDLADAQASDRLGPVTAHVLRGIARAVTTEPQAS